MRNRLHAYSLIVAVIALVPGVCAQAPPAPPPPVATTAPASAAELAARLTAVVQTALPGWTITEAPLVCDRECVARDLPQEAALVASFDFRWSLTVRLMPPDPRQPMEARIFCMGEDLDAFGMFAASRTDNTVLGPIAPQSFWAGNDFHIWRGTFYFRLVPASGDKLLRASVMAAGEALAAQVPLPDKLPAMMRLMPQSRNLPYTLRYYRRDTLGLPTLSDGLVDTYLEDRQQFTLALLRAADDTAAVALYDMVVGLLGEGALATPVPGLGEAAVSFTGARYGLCYVLHEGRYVVATLGVHDRVTAEGLLRIMGTSIRISRFD